MRIKSLTGIYKGKSIIAAKNLRNLCKKDEEEKVFLFMFLKRSVEG